MYKVSRLPVDDDGIGLVTKMAVPQNCICQNRLLLYCNCHTSVDFKEAGNFCTSWRSLSHWSYDNGHQLSSCPGVADGVLMSIWVFTIFLSFFFKSQTKTKWHIQLVHSNYIAVVDPHVFGWNSSSTDTQRGKFSVFVFCAACSLFWGCPIADFLKGIHILDTFFLSVLFKMWGLMTVPKLETEPRSSGLEVSN